MGIDLTPRCVKCGCELELGSMKALSDGKGYVCQNCYERGGKSNSSFTVDKDRLRSIPAENKDSIQNIEEDGSLLNSEDIFDQKEYICNSCSYQFKKKSDSMAVICPYCGKRDVSEKIDTNADVLLD